MSPGVAPLGIGIVGLGTAGAAMLGAVLRHGGVRLRAVADPLVDDLPVGGLASVSAYRSVEALLEDRDVEAVYIATPTLLHGAHVRLAVEAGRHVVVEKPVTARSSEVRALRELAEQSGVAVVVGHSESFEPYAVAARTAVMGGELGEVIAVVAEKVTDWMRRPRRPDELDPGAGGGIIRRQGVHQVDVVRSLLPGRSFRLRHARIHPDPVRCAAGGYVAWLDAGPASALLIQDGRGALVAPPPASAGRGARSSPAAEKRQRAAALVSRVVATGSAPALGGSDREQLVVLGSAGRLVGGAGGVVVGTRGADQVVDLRRYPEGRAAVLDELLGVLDGAPAFHDLSWGEENVRLCEAIGAAGSQ